jgi:DNA primase
VVTRGSRFERDGHLQDIFDALDLEEWLEYHSLDYRRTAGGDNLQLKVCPVCHDDRWRVYMERNKKLGVCFHADCNARFNLFKFACAMFDGDKRRTIAHFEDYGSRILHRPRKVEVIKPVILGDLVLPESVALPTPEGHTHPYLIDRSVLLTTQSRFGLRWCEKGVWNYADTAGVNRSLRYDNRILFPVFDLDNRCRTFVGRDTTGDSSLRYLFPPRLPSAASFFYGAELAQEAEHLIIGEGPFDCLAIHQALEHPDFHNCAALGSFGLSIGHGDSEGNDQLGQLLRLRRGAARRVTMLWDGEANALRHALDAASLLTRNGFAVNIGLLPLDADPSSVDTTTIRRAIADACLYTTRIQMTYTLKSPYG